MRATVRTLNENGQHALTTVRRACPARLPRTPPLAIATAIVEACFSGFTSMKDRHRSVLGDGRVLDALISRQAVDVFANGTVSFRELELRQDAHTHRLPW